MEALVSIVAVLVATPIMLDRRGNDDDPTS